MSFGGQIAIASCGAMLFAANVAPTEEIIMIATETRIEKLAGLAGFSLPLTALILYYIEFTGSAQHAHITGIASVVIGTVVTYAVALIISAAVLWFFGRSIRHWPPASRRRSSLVSPLLWVPRRGGFCCNENAGEELDRMVGLRVERHGNSRAAELPFLRERDDR